jgi:hypothetical protein
MELVDVRATIDSGTHHWVTPGWGASYVDGTLGSTLPEVLVRSSSDPVLLRGFSPNLTDDGGWGTAFDSIMLFVMAGVSGSNFIRFGWDTTALIIVDGVPLSLFDLPPDFQFTSLTFAFAAGGATALPASAAAWSRMSAWEGQR